MRIIQFVPGESSDIAVSRPGRTTAPLGRPATIRSRRATAGMPPVVPATNTGSAGGLACQASAWASSSATWRAAGFISPCSASHVGPGARDDVQEFQRLRPMRGIGRFGGVGQLVGQIDFRPLRLVHQ